MNKRKKQCDSSSSLGPPTVGVNALLGLVLFHEFTNQIPRIISSVRELMSFAAGFSKCLTILGNTALTLSCRRSLSYRNQSIDLLCKAMNWFIYDTNLRHEKVKGLRVNIPISVM